MNLSSMIVIGICAMLILAIGIIFFVILYQRRVIAHQQELKKINAEKELELVQASIRSEEGERNRIAAELHDDVAATLSSARLFMYKNKDADFDEERINQSKKLLDESIKKIRDISHKLQPSHLQHLGLQLSLQSLLETLNKSGTINSSFVELDEIPRLSDTVELTAYRISQELITNILKHAGASKILLETGKNKNEMFLIFMHDGVGITNEMYQKLIYKKGSTGLKNIVNRLKSVNGRIAFDKTRDQQYTTEVRIPLN
jgi:two-component system, NarL family, sensor kinase